ncbi:hypothetical protein [Nocardia aurantia]|uniref:RES domain-containing protein n=1 Tax=Nocardia aurantia TaxID=2585199 RepID=A0A7K0DV60_9NOCA|nr:hypothetical protein [Nocardia aurantia]MQY29639.1 hypothetical protein [Nocardia aurantia]
MPDPIGRSIARAIEHIAGRLAEDLSAAGDNLATGYDRVQRIVGRMVRGARDAERDTAAIENAAERLATARSAPLTATPRPDPEALYNGARLWQCEQIFPRAFRSDVPAGEAGYIRTAAHSTAEGVVYLTDSTEIADVYGTITSWTDVRDGLPRFHPAGMVLGIDKSRVTAEWMAAEEHSARTLVEGVSDRVLTTTGRIDTSAVTSARFVLYRDIVDNPQLTMVADGFPGFEGLTQAQLHDPALIAERLEAVADAVRRQYPDIDVSVGTSGLPRDEAVRLFEAT